MTHINVQDEVTDIFDRMSRLIKRATKCSLVEYHIDQAWKEYCALDLTDDPNTDDYNNQFFRAVTEIETFDEIAPEVYAAAQEQDCPQNIVFRKGKKCVVVTFAGGGFEFETMVDDYDDWSIAE